MLAVLGPIITVIRSFTRSVPPWLEGSALIGGLLATALLCLWCAIYVRVEPHLVRIALIWMTLLFSFLCVALFTAGPVH
jgi:hypothetical protein